MIKTLFPKKLKRIFLLCLIIMVAMFQCFLYFLNRGYEEQIYEIDYPLLSELVDYYDTIKNSPFDFIKYRACRRKIINKFFDKEISRSKGNPVLIYSLENLRTYHDINKFVHNTEIQIKTVYNCTDYNFEENKFFISVKRSNFWNKNDIFLFVICNNKELEAIQII